MRNEIAVFGGGCFWCTEAIFKSLKGVKNVTPGYAGGDMDYPNEYEIHSGFTGHAEVVRVEYDSSIISYETLLEVFFALHNPTSLNRQGNDVGSEYRSLILYTSEEQKEIAKNYMDELVSKKIYEEPIVTQLVPLEKFFDAESYHQNYYETHKDEPYCELVISPKLQKLREKFGNLIGE